MDKIFHRNALAQQMAQQLLNPGVLDEGLPGWHEKGYPVEGQTASAPAKP